MWYCDKNICYIDLFLIFFWYDFIYFQKYKLKMGFNRHNSAITTKQQINRKNKLRVVFDENARKDFLTGFRKRKDERRQKAKEQIELNLKNEIKKIKSESRTKVRGGEGGIL